MQPVRSMMDLDREPWVSATDAMVKAGCRGTFESKKLVAPDGRSVRLVHYDGDGPPHFHLRASSLYVFDGAIELRDRVAGAGTWVLEPFGAIHPRTLFKNVTYGFGMSEGAGPGYVLVDDLERPVDMYVLSGRAQFSDAVAERGWWVHEPAGAVDDEVRFPVETELLVNTYGTVLEYGSGESIARIIDGYSI